MSSKLDLTDCLIIHLERSLERKRQVKKLTKKPPYRTTVIEAVDGGKPNKDLSKSYISRIFRLIIHLACA